MSCNEYAGYRRLSRYTLSGLPGRQCRLQKVEASVGIHVLSQQRDFFHPLSGEIGRFGEYVIQVAGKFLPRGCKAQRRKVQYLLHPSMMEIKATGPSARGSGNRSNFSISGKEISTTGLPVCCASSYNPGSRCKVCGTEYDVDIRRSFVESLSLPGWRRNLPRLS